MRFYKTVRFHVTQMGHVVGPKSTFVVHEGIIMRKESLNRWQVLLIWYWILANFTQIIYFIDDHTNKLEVIFQDQLQSEKCVCIHLLPPLVFMTNYHIFE